ncbi:LysM peptidoglycan-binding domain-containing protein [Flavobacteriales bacterium]|nr:LysM peptidoglycan-binding domain-containing protein [Flavobacteriales bacterium]
MRISVIVYALLFCLSLKASVSLQSKIDSIFIDETINKKTEQTHNLQLNIFHQRLDRLDKKSPMDLSYNKKVQPFIDNYLGNNKLLIARMQGLSPYYFSIFEQMLDKYDLPLELKYLPIVESALNPKAKSHSGASGLWQFMYLTGKQYGLNVSSYIDERQDPIKSTEAACVYFLQLYEMFGDWNLVLAAYNGGPGYIQRKIASAGTNNFWQLQDYLRKETRNYVPTFIAVNYAMNYAKFHNINPIEPEIFFENTDTIILKQQVDLKVLNEIICINSETINYLNPSFKKQIYPAGATLILPSEIANDFLLNEQTNYAFIEMVENKEILINEERIVYRVKKGDYLGKIAKEHQVYIFEIKEWNNLKTTNLDIGDKLVLFVKNDKELLSTKQPLAKNEYVVKKGDTLWDIAQKHKGVSVWKIKSLNNLESDNLKPGTKLILPTT